MTQMNIDQARFNMIEQQIRPWEVLDHHVLSVMAEIPRELFVPKQYRALAFTDVEIPLDEGQVILPPRLEGRMMQSLNIKADDRILEIGTGCGYMTSCLARLGDSVVTVDISEALSRQARENIASDDISPDIKQDLKNISFRIGNAAEEWDHDGPFDVIVITGSVPRLSKKLKGLLHKRGRLFVIEGVEPVMHAKLITRTSSNDFQEEVLFESVIPPLTGIEQKEEFVF